MEVWFRPNQGTQQRCRTVHQWPVSVEKCHHQVVEVEKKSASYRQKWSCYQCYDVRWSKAPRRSARRKKTVNAVAILCNYIITSQKYFTRNSHCERSVFLASQPHNMTRFTVRVWGIRSNITWNVRGAARLRISRRTSRALRIQQLKRSFIPQEVCLFFFYFKHHWAVFLDGARPLVLRPGLILHPWLSPVIISFTNKLIR